MQFCYINDSLQTEWENLVKKTSYSGFMQSFFWADFKRTVGWESYKIGIVENGKLVGGAIVLKFPFSENKNFLYIPDGPIIPKHNSQEYFDEFIGELDKVADLIGDNLTTHLRIEPKLPTLPDYYKRFRKAPYNLQPKHTLLINLKDAEQEILAQMKPKGRYNIKVALKHEVSITATSLEQGIDVFLPIYHQTKQRNNFMGKKDFFFKHLVHILPNSENAKFFFAQKDQKVLAGGLIIFCGNMATYFFGASADEEKHTMAPYLLHWEIMKYAKQQGYNWYDFYGITSSTNPNHSWAGFTALKKKFGGEEFSSIGAYDFVYNKKLYQEYLKESDEV